MKSKRVIPVYAPKDLVLALQDGMYALESFFTDKVKMQNKLTKSDHDVQKILRKMQKVAIKYSYK